MERRTNVGLLLRKMASNFGSSSVTFLVASIDFGTTYSGWAYSFYHDFKADPTKGYVKQWHSGSGTLTTEKTPTVVLVKPDGKTLEAFGYEAENRYKELTESDEHRDYYYFRKFKMKLHKQLTERIDRNFTLEDELGKNLPALDVFTMAVRYLVEDMQSVARMRVTGEIKTSDVHWVLTVPAIWTDQAKQFMREAAEKAGIERYKLSIALEPEAASIYCRHLPMDSTIGRNEMSVSSLPVGTKYMILDAGGGTIDITVHEVNDKLRVKEVIAASGGGWGSTIVDEAFEDLIQDLVGRDVYKAFKQEQTEDWLEMMRDFEVKKRTIRPEKEGKIMMKFPVSLSRMSEKTHGHDLAEYIRDSPEYSKDVEFVWDKIKFQTNIFKSLFEKSNKRIIKHVQDVIKEEKLNNLNLILMVGGYSESPMLQQAVSKAFPMMKVIIPNEASTAILRGALICGHSPELITERVLKYTYGLGVARKFIEGKHPECRRFKTDTGDYCDGLFSKHVERGQIVKVGVSQIERSYLPTHRYQSSVHFELFASELTDPQYVDIGCFKIGSIDVSIVQGDLDCAVEVRFTFGGTEIEVDAIVEKTGEKKKVSIDFLG